MRLGALFVAVCMTVIAVSAGVVVYFAYGFSGADAIVVAIAAVTALALYNAVSSRVNIRSVVGPQLAELSRSGADIARQLAETGRRLAAVEAKLERSLARGEATAEPLAFEISELGALVDQLAESVALHESRLAAVEQARTESKRSLPPRPPAPRLESPPHEALADEPEPFLPEPPRPAAPRSERFEPPLSEPMRAEPVRSESMRSDLTRPEPVLPEPPKAQPQKLEAEPEIAPTETPKSEALKAILSEFRAAQSKAEAPRPQSLKPEPLKPAPRAELSKAELSKAEPPKSPPVLARADAAKSLAAAPVPAPPRAAEPVAGEVAIVVEPAPAAPAPVPVPAAPVPSAIAARERLEADSSVTREMLAAVRGAIEANRVDLHLQPIVTLPQRKVRFYEAMSRLRMQSGDVVMASEFISQAEAGGLMPKIDNLVLFRCVQVLRRLLLKNREVGVFCNISVATLTDAVVFPQLIEFLDANRAIAPALVLEFTQGALRGAGPIETESLAALRACGYSFSMDNVTDMRLDPRDLTSRGFRYVKMRASLILNRSNVNSDIHPGDLPDLLGRFGIDLIAEKIESEGTVVDLLDYDVKFGQGFLFSPPRPVRAEALQGVGDRNDVVARERPDAGTGGGETKGAGGAPASASKGLRSAGLPRVARRI